MILRSNTIISRIIWLHVVVVGLAVIVISLAAGWLLNSIATDFENQELRQNADVVAKYVQVQVDGTLTLDLPADLRAFYEDGLRGFSLSVVNKSGQVLFSTSPGGTAIQTLDPNRTAAEFFQRSSAGKAYYGVNIPEHVGDETVWVQLAQYVDHPDVIIDNIITDFLQRIVWFVLPIMGLLFLADIAIVRLALRPVNAASELALSIGPSRIDQRLPITGLPGEIMPLVDAVNKAFGKLERGFRLQREFTADVAHELRTPLAVLRMKIDGVSDQPTANSLRRDVDAMTHVVNQLLMLAELESAIADLNEVVDLRSVCTEVITLVAPMALAQRKRVALTGSEGKVWINGNGTLLFQAIRNVVDNAINFTKPDTTVEVNVRPTGTVSIIDEGPGVSEGERELIFQRFWRRNRDGGFGGAGLGLSIVSRIVEAHGGSVRVVNRPTGGAIFYLNMSVAAELDTGVDSSSIQDDGVRVTPVSV